MTIIVPELTEEYIAKLKDAYFKPGHYKGALQGPLVNVAQLVIADIKALNVPAAKPAPPAPPAQTAPAESKPQETTNHE